MQTITASNPMHIYARAGNYTVTASNGITHFNLNNGADRDKLIDVAQWGSVSWTSMERAFNGASMMMNASDTPNLAGVTSMAYMFSGATTFNQDISGWDVQTVTDMSGMFFTASAFNQNIGRWDVFRVR